MALPGLGAFLRLQRVPTCERRLGRRRALLRLGVVHAPVFLEDMRVPPNELLDHGPQRIVDREQARLGGHLREEHPLEDVVADLLLQRRRVATLDGIDHLVGLFEHERRERLERLLAIPWTAFRRSQRAHDRHELLERCLAWSRDICRPSTVFVLFVDLRVQC